MTLALRVRTLAVGALAALALGACKGGSTPTGTTTPPANSNTITLNGATVTVGIAATNAARENGLMGVTRMAADSGMLFVFADDRQRAFWMCHTPIPLSIIFLDANKKVVFMADMAPNTTTQYGGLNAAQMRYALEVNQGWSASHSITLNTLATFTLPAGLVIEPDAQGSSTCSP